MAPSMKPQLRGLLHSQIKTNLIVAIGLSIVGGIAYKVLVNDPQKQKYLDYYKNFDIDKEFEIMKNKGVFDSCAPNS